MNDAYTIAVNTLAATTAQLHLPELASRSLQAEVLRLDKIHPVISGNKWFKLKYHLAAAQLGKHPSIVTFGGAYSNHIAATACICRQQGFQSAGIIRGERPAVLSDTLYDAASDGMELHFVSRDDYARKLDSDAVKALLGRYPYSYVIPEGGSGENGIRGCREIGGLAALPHYSHIMCCIGTGTMFTGLAQCMGANQRLVGIPVLKLDNDAQLASLRRLREDAGVQCPYDVLPHHFGGYARKTPELIRLMNDFYTRTGIPTDFVYTGKLVAALLELVQTGYFPPASRILLIHSGGLQGNRSLPPGTLVY